MAGNEMHMVRHMRADIAYHRTFDRAHIAHRGAMLQMGRDLFRDLAIGADRRAQDDEIGIPDRGSRTLMNLIEEPDAPDNAARRSTLCITGNIAGELFAANDMRQRGPYETQTDQRDALVDDACHARNSFSAAMTAWFASSEPTVIRKA